MTWLENLGNVLTTGVICTYAAYDLYRRWQNSAEQENRQIEPIPSSMAASSSSSSGAWRTVQQSGPGWHTTTVTFGDSTQPGVLTLHNLLGPESSTGLEGPSDLMQLFQDLHFSLQSPMALGNREFNEDDYELLSALDEGIRRRTPISEAALAALPTHKFRASSQGARKETEEDEQICSICLDDFVAEQEVKTLPCLHHFHTGCIEEWLRQQGSSVSCPVCKTPVFEGQRI